MTGLTRAKVANLQIAERLETMTEGLAKVVYCPEAMLAGQEPGSRGHKLYCYLEAEATEFWLDDRAPEPQPAQFAECLRRLASRLEHLAEEIESNPSVP